MTNIFQTYGLNYCIGKYLTFEEARKMAEITNDISYFHSLEELNYYQASFLAEKYKTNSFFKQVKTLNADTNFTNEDLKHLLNLKQLVCWSNKNFTDEGLRHLPNLQTLSCKINENFTDEGLKFVPKLQKLDCGCNKNFTNKGLRFVPNLEFLDCNYKF